MYSVEQLANGLRNPRMALRELNRLYYRQLYTRPYNDAGIDVFAADWDNLLILDACRYDYFERENTLPGRVQRRQSRGSSTIEFLKGNFSGRELHDVVYVTANPQLYRNPSIDPSLHATVDVWREEGWNDEHRTVLPETVTEFGERAGARYPNKRLVVHYIQPHYPFLGPSGREHFDHDSLAIWNKIRTGELTVDDETLKNAYNENLQLVMPHVQSLMDALDGKTVVTADHGQAFGERLGPLRLRYYGHPPSVYADPLVTVPWLVDDRGERREIVPEPPETDDRDEAPEVTERLEQLGYVE